jgi:hypothetical protein
MLEPERQKTVKIIKLVDSMCKRLNPIESEVCTVMTMRGTTFWKVIPNGR